MQLHQAARTQILSTLTPAHKALLAEIAGQLATAANPDYTGAAKRLDAALSASEKQHILAIGKNIHAKMETMMPRAQHPHGSMMEHGDMDSHMMSDAGALLLMVSMMPMHD